MDIKEDAKRYVKNSLFGSKTKGQVAYNAYLKGVKAILNILQIDIAIKAAEHEAEYGYGEPHLDWVDDLIVKHLKDIISEDECEKLQLANDSLVTALGMLEASKEDKLKSLGLSLEERSCFKVSVSSYSSVVETEVLFKGERCLLYLSLEDLLEIETSEELWKRVKSV